METDKHYLRVGSFVLLLMLGVAGFSVWLVGSYDKSKYTLYRIHFTESVSGLNVGGPVKFRGVPVGKIESMLIEPSDMRQIRVDVSILKSTPIKTDTYADLKLQGITGGVFIELSGTTSDAEQLAGSDEDGPPEIPSHTSTLTEIMDILPQILEKVSHIAEQTNKVFSDKNITAFGDMMENLQKTSRDISQTTRSIKDNPSKLIFPPKEKGIPAP